MKRFKLLLCLTLVVIVLSVGVVAFAGNADTAETYPTPYIGEYTSNDGSGHTGLAHIVFGKVSNVDAECGILLTDIDEGWTKKFEVKHNPNGTKRISAEGEFGIALYNLLDGEYTVCVYTGSDGNRVCGDSFTLRAGVSFYTVTYVYGDEVTTEAVAVGTVPAAEVEFVNDGYNIAGWQTESGEVYDITAPVYDDVTLYPLWTPTNTARVTLSGNPAYLTYEANPKAGEMVTLEFDVVEILANSTIGNAKRFGFGLVDGSTTRAGFMSTDSANLLTGSGTLVGEHTLKSDYIGNTITELTNIPTFKSGDKVKVEYKPYASSTEKGYIKAYVKEKSANDDSYVLVGGVEDITATSGKLALMTDRGTVLDMIVANMSFKTESGDLGIKNEAYGYESGGLYTRISNTVADDEIAYEIFTDTPSTVIVGSKTRLDLEYGDEYVMEFKVDFSNIGDYEAGVVNRQTGNIGIGITSEDRVGWSSSPSAVNNSVSLWYNNSGWRIQARLVDGNGTAQKEDFQEENDLFTVTYPLPEAFKELFKTGNDVRIVYTPYFSAEETGGEEQLGSLVIYAKGPQHSSYYVWASITDIPQSLSPRDNIGAYIWSEEKGQGRRLVLSNFTTRVGDTYVYSASGNDVGLNVTDMSGGDYYAHSLTLDKSTLGMLVGSESTLVATVEPDDLLTWSSSDEGIVTVDEGKVTAVGKGTATVSVSTPGGKTAKCEVTVKDELTVTLMLGDEVYDTVSASYENGYKITSLPVIEDITDDYSDVYYFGGWYTDSDYTTAVSLDTVYSTDKTVYGDYRCAYLYDVVGNDVVIRGVIDEIKTIGELIIPDTIDNKSVTEIGYEAFRGSDLIQVTIPSSIIKISDGAFRESRELTAVTIEGKGLQTVGNSVFRDCIRINSATALILPSSVTSVGELAFYGANHTNYGGMYMLDYQKKQYYSPKYVFEFLGADVMPIAMYGEIVSNDRDNGNIAAGVADPTYGVGLDVALKDFVDSGCNLMLPNSLVNAVQSEDPTVERSYGYYLKKLEEYGAMMTYRDMSLCGLLEEEYEGNAGTKYEHIPSLYKPTTNATLNSYINLFSPKFASYAGAFVKDEPGWVDWVDEFEDSYSFYQRTGSSGSTDLATDENGDYITVTKKKGRMDDGHRVWKKYLPNKLMFVNLLQTYAPSWALPNGFFGYNDGGQLNGVPDFTGKWAPLDGELDYEYYYRTYVESVQPELFSYDYYPLADGAGNLKRTHFEQLNYANYYSGEYYKQYHGTDTGIPFWPMIQLCGWNGYRPGVGATSAEVNWQINTAFAYGAKGYTYYSYNALGSAGGAIDEYGNKLDGYYMIQQINGYSQAMAKWLLNADVDHLTQVGANPNCYDWVGNVSSTVEETPARMLIPQDTSMVWSLVSSSGVPHLVSHMKYYGNNNFYREGVDGDVRELYFVCNNSIDTAGNITLNFGSTVSGSYIYQGVEYSFSGTSLTLNVGAGQGFAILLNK